MINYFRYHRISGTRGTEGRSSRQIGIPDIAALMTSTCYIEVVKISAEREGASDNHHTAFY